MHYFTLLYVDLYGELPRISKKVQERRMALAGHCVRHPEVPANPLILWEPTQRTKKYRETNTLLCECIKKDAAVENREELTALMLNRTELRKVSGRFRDVGY